MTNDQNSNGQTEAVGPFFRFDRKDMRHHTLIVGPTRAGKTDVNMSLTAAELADIRGVDQAENDGKISGANDGQ